MGLLADIYQTILATRTLNLDCIDFNYYNHKSKGGIEFHEPLYYLSKEEKNQILDYLEKELNKYKKINDTKNFNINLLTTKEDLKGISIEINKINESNFSELIDIPNKDYFNNSLEIITISLKSRDEHKINDLEEAAKLYSTLFKDNQNFPFGDYRIKGNKLSIDLINNNRDFFIDLLLFIDLNLSFKSGITAQEILEIQGKETIEKLFKFALSINGKTQSNKNFLISLIKIISENKSLKSRFNKWIHILNALKIFISLSFNLELNYKELVGDVPEQILLHQNSFLKQLALDYISKQYQYSPELLKAIDFDEFTVSCYFPKYKNGIKITLKLPGLNQFIILNTN
jgi:hypothetical protein